MIKRSLVVLDASPRSAVRLRLALEFARTHSGEVTALYAVVPSLLGSLWVAGDAMAGAATMLADLDRAQRDRARAVFQQAGHADVSSWLDGGDTPYPTLLREAFLHDLVVLGQPDVSDSQTGVLPPDLVPAAILDSGRPALLVPSTGQFVSADGPVLVAWKGTREAARAVSASLPWLRRATRIHVAVPADPEGVEAPSQGLEHWLGLQGVKSPVQRHAITAGGEGAQLLALAGQLEARLLVMGCYGHSRAREWILGGATRTVLRSMNLPVLMAH